MTELESFEKIDKAIVSFKQKEGAYKGIKVASKQNSDVPDFNWRQLTWHDSELNFLMEIFPNGEKEIIPSWTFYAATWYNQNKKRYYTSKKIAEKTTLDFIANDFESFLLKGFQY